MSDPTTEQMAAARRRVVNSKKAKAVIRACMVSVIEGVVEATGKRVGDGGTVRSVPMTKDGIVPIGVDVSVPDAIRAGGFINVTEMFHNAAERWSRVEVDWSETEKFCDID